MSRRLVAPRPLALLLAVLLAVPPATLLGSGRAAAQLPDATFRFQTNGSALPLTAGDYYTASSGGAGSHYLLVVVPCGWPEGRPIHLDLWSPEINVDATTDEIGGTAPDPTEFELYGPFADPTSAGRPAPGAGTVRTVFPPSAPGSAETWVRWATLDPATCGTYVVRSAVLDPDPGTPPAGGDDRNGWRLRVGADDDSDPTDPPPADATDADGVPGTNDELVVAVLDVTLRHDAGGTRCLTLYEYSPPGADALTLHNFDLDLSGRVRYYAPGEAIDPDGLVGGRAGTTSGDGTWNGSSDATRVGDTVPDPDPGWWAQVVCADDHDQFVAEGTTDTPALLTPPPTPVLSVSKTADVDAVDPGDPITYTATVTNTSTGPTAGAALGVRVVDTLPDGATLLDCNWVAPATGTCTASSSTVTAALDGWLPAGATAELTIRITAGGAPQQVDVVEVTWQDVLGNPYGPVTDTETTPVFTGEVCYVVADSGPSGGGADHLLRAAPASGAVAGIGDTGTTSIEAAAYDPVSGTLYATDGGQLGVLDPTAGTFTPRPLPAGTAGGALGEITLGDLDGLTVDPFTGELWATQRRGAEDLLVVLDPTTGAHVPDRFGPGVDYLPITGYADGRDDVDDIVVVDATLYAVINTGGNPSRDQLAVVDRTTGTITGTVDLTVGGAPLPDVEGLSASIDGTLYATTGTGGDATTDGRLWRIDPATGAATEVAALRVGADHEAVACRTAPAVELRGTVFDDRDGDASPGADDVGLAGVPVHLWRDTDGDGTVSAGDVEVLVAATGPGGALDVAVAATGRFVVAVDPADLPPGVPTTPLSYALDVVAGDTIDGLDVGVRTAAIGGMVWVDSDGDGIREAGESGLGGVVVTLEDPGGAVLATTTTDADGRYRFAGLPGGDYRVAVTAPDASWRFSPADVGGDDTVDSDVDPSDGRTPIVSLADGEQTGSVDAGLFAPGSISGVIWEDLDADGVREAGEVPLAGVEVSVLRDDDGDGIGDTLAVVVTSAADGSYTAEGLPAGTYQVVASGGVPADARPSATPVVVLPAGGTVVGADVGVYQPTSIVGVVWEDRDGDGVRGATEPPTGGVEVSALVDDDGDGTAERVVDVTTTAADGSYQLTGLDPATYTVAVTGGLPADATARPQMVVTTSGTARTDVDLAWTRPATLAGLVWEDLDGDGTPDPGEPGLASVTVTVIGDTDGDGSAEVVSLVTDLAGRYEASGLHPGVYTVDVEDPPDMVLTTGDDPATLTLTSGTTTTHDVGFWRPATITGVAFDDTNGNGSRQPAEPPRPDVTISLHSDPDGDGDAADGALLASTTTDADGRYTFGGLPPGTYVVAADPPPGTVPTSPTDVPVALGAGEVATVDFGTEPVRAGVTVDPDHSTTVEAPGTLTAAHTITNTGNTTDTFTLTATTDLGWTTTVYRDDDGDGAWDPTTETTVLDRVTLDAGGSQPLVVVVDVPVTSRGTVATTQLTATSTVDPAVQDQATTTTTVVAPLLGLDWSSDAAGTATPGQPVTYTLVVHNRDGAATARDLTVDVTLADPDHGTIDSVDGAPATLPVLLGDLGPGETATVTVQVTLARPLADGTVVTALASVTASNPTVVCEPDGCLVAASDTVVSDPIPTFVDTAAPSPTVRPAEEVTYTITVGNRADATDTWREVVVVHDPPPDATYVPGSTTVDGSPVPDAADGRSPLHPDHGGLLLGDLVPGQVRTVTVRVRVEDPVAVGTTLTDVAQASGSNAGPVFDATTLTVDVRHGVDLGPEGARTTEAPAQVVYAHTLTNTGTVTDTYTLTAATDRGWATAVHLDLDADGQLDPDDPLLGTTPQVAGGQTLPLLVVVEVPAGVSSGTVGVTTLVAASDTVAEATAETFDTTTVAAPVLAVTKTVSPSSTAINPGQELTYTITVRNTGGATARSVVVTDDTPSGTSYRRGTTRLDGVPVTDGPGGDGNPLATVNGGVALGDLPPGGSRELRFAVVVSATAPDGTVISNTATATTARGLVASASVSQLVTASPVLDVTKDAQPAPGPVAPGQRITYTLTVRNVGTATAAGVRLTDPPPANTVYVPGSTTLDGVAVSDVDGGSPLAGTSGGLLLGDLSPGAVRTVTFAVTVTDPLPAGAEIINRATATSSEGVSATSPELRHQVRTSPAVDLSPDRTAAVEPPGPAVHAHTLTNLGDVTDTYTLTTATTQGWPVTVYRDDDGDGTWDPTRETTAVTSLGPLAPGASIGLFVVVDVPTDAAPGAREVTTLTATSSQAATVSDQVTDTTTVLGARLEVLKSAVPSAEQVNPGAVITYTITVRNRGTSTATEVRVVDDTPTGTSYRPGSTTLDGSPLGDAADGDGNPLAGSGLLLGDLAPGAVRAVSFEVRVDADEGSTISNVATVTATGIDPLTATRVHTVVRGAVLDVHKVADPDPSEPLTAGQQVTYTITVRNLGEETAAAVRLVDDTPVGTSYVAGSTTVGGVAVPDGPADPNPLASRYGGLLLGDLAPGDPPVVVVTSVEVVDPITDGTTITNVATAEARDLPAASSAPVTHEVDVSPAVALAADRSGNARAGTTISYALQLTNTGDVSDAYDLITSGTRGWPTRVHLDRDGDGTIDADDPPIATSPLLPPGGTLALVVAIDVPAGTPVGTVDRTTVRARSTAEAAVAASATLTTTVVAAALELTKTATPQTLRPGGVATYTLTVRSVGEVAASDVRLFDPVPAGTRFLPGSVTLDGVAVADDGTSPLLTGLELGTLPPGSTRTVRFAVEVDRDPPPTLVTNVAEATAVDAPTARAGVVQPVSTTVALELSPGTARTVTPGTTVIFPHTVRNVGDVPDEVVLSATTGLGFTTAVHRDVDGDGVLDPEDTTLDGPLALAAGAAAQVLVAVSLPTGVAPGVSDTVTVTATSLTDPVVVLTATDTLTVIRAGLLVSKTATRELVGPGERSGFAIEVHNTGSAPARQVTVSDALPVGLAVEEVRVDGVPVPDGAAALDDGLLLGDLPAGGVRTVELDVVVDPLVAPGSMLTNIAVADSPDTGPAASNPAVITVAPAAVEVRKTVDRTEVTPGGSVTWSLTISNLSGSTIEDVSVTDPLPPELALVPDSVRVDGVPAAPAVLEGHSLGPLAAGGVRTVTFTTRVVATAGTVVTNVASVRHQDRTVVSNTVAVVVVAGLPATGADLPRTLATGGSAIALGWALLYVARPQRAPEVGAGDDRRGRTPPGGRGHRR